ncbi:MAG: SsrA-binding protein SmpB [Patescibacteria group bacterium]|jgi:SsrA-binding protein
MPTYGINKRANFDYEILAKYEAGIVLAGYEVKSVKTGHISLKGAFVTLKNRANKDLPEAYLTNCHIPLYKHAGKILNYDPYKSRKLLLKKSEISHILGKRQEKGLTLVPIKVYNKGSLIKLEFGIGKGKKKVDKREDIKNKDIVRKLQTMKKQY